jgi:hypothetical protein
LRLASYTNDVLFAFAASDAMDVNYFSVSIYVYHCSWVRCVHSLLEVAEQKGEKFRYSAEEAAELGFILTDQPAPSQTEVSEGACLPTDELAVEAGRADAVSLVLSPALAASIEDSSSPSPIAASPKLSGLVSAPVSELAFSKDDLADIAQLASFLQVKQIDIFIITLFAFIGL